MTSIVKLEALSGVQDDGPLCYMLYVDEVGILLDCGWDERFDMNYIESIKRRIPQINAVVLTYPDTAHLGALPYLVGKCGLKCPIYATLPVYKMGNLYLKDWILSHKYVEDFTLFDTDDVDSAFEMIEYVKFGQLINLKGDNGLQIMPLIAGHILGGALWRITKMGEEEIVYAVDFNIRKERHLNGCTFDGVGRPNLFITDAFSALYTQPKSKMRDENLLSKLITTLRGGGDALVVIDTAGRVLELSYMLDHFFSNRESGLTMYNLVLLNHVASNVVESAKSLLEFMSEKLLRLCESGKPNPFQFSYLKCCHSLAELNAVRSPKVVLTSGLDMEAGFSRELFLEWCTDSKNIVIITGRSNEQSLGSKLIQIAEAREQRKPTNNVVNLLVKRRIRLEGVELETYRVQKKKQEEEESQKRLENVRRNIRIEQAESSDESDDDEFDYMDRKQPFNDNLDINPELAYGYDIMTRFEQTQKTSFFKRNRKQFPMFPHIEEKAKWDDYGQIICPEDYTLHDTLGLNQNTVFKQLNQMKTELKEEDEESNASDSEVVMEVWPTKCISYEENIEVFAKLAFIDFEGRTDADSIRKVINQIRPKQLVLVHGNAQSTKALADYCRQNESQIKTFAPTIGELIDLTTETHIYQVTLSDPLMSQLAFQQVRDAELCWVDARLKKRKTRSTVEFPAESNDIELIESQQEDSFMEVDIEGAPKAIGEKVSTTSDQLCLEVVPSNNIPSHEPIFVNDPKLSDIRIFLNKSGFSAEFSGGVLYVNDVLRISRNEAGKFEIEGAASAETYSIQDALYSHFAIV